MHLKALLQSTAELLTELLYFFQLRYIFYNRVKNPFISGLSSTKFSESPLEISPGRSVTLPVVNGYIIVSSIALIERREK